MKIKLIILLVCMASSYTVTAQVVSNPLQAQFITKDIANFWNAFDSLEAGYEGNPFEDLYIKKGSAGIQAFMAGRIESGTSLLNKVRERKGDYVKARENSLSMLDKEKQCRATFLALKYLYPQAVFPPVYFVIGRFNSGGHSHPDGLVIGAEMVQSADVPDMLRTNWYITSRIALQKKTATCWQPVSTRAARILSESLYQVEAPTSKRMLTAMRMRKNSGLPSQKSWMTGKTAMTGFTTTSQRMAIPLTWVTG